MRIVVLIVMGLLVSAVTVAGLGGMLLFSTDRVHVPPPPPPARVDEGLGDHTRRVATANAEAQTCFDQGLAFLYAFNHDEAIRRFERTLSHDPDCAMAHWGVALASGGHINRPMVDAARAKRAFAASRRALELAEQGSPADRALIEALVKRYADPLPADRTMLERAYADAMRAAWRAHPDDADIGALFAESRMNLRPWDLWTHEGQPRPETPEIVATLEEVLRLNPRHPLALHLYIHAVEASPDPGKADEAAERLRHLQPGLGHMVHMPSHIDVRRGRWRKAIEANERAIEADARYRARHPQQDFYHLYMAHNYHMLAFAAMQTGESERALTAVRTMLQSVPPDWLAVPENAALADGFLAAPGKVLLRFGRWEEVLREPAPPAGFPIARTLWHHARGVALAAQGHTDKARAEWLALQTSAKDTPATATFGNNRAADIFAVAEAMLEGEILAQEGNLDDAIARLREAVKREDALRYDEPPGWILPVRHALGGFLLRQGKVAEAEAVYREDLRRWPNNGWGLYGLMQCLERQGQKDEAKQVRQKWQEVWKRGDIRIHASCLCVPPEPREKP